MKIAEITRDNKLLIRGKFYDTFLGFDEEEEIDEDGLEIDENFEIDPDAECGEIFSSLLGLEIHDVPVENHFSIDKNGNLFTAEVHTGHDSVRVNSNKELYVNELIEEAIE